jgi:hypothetical protein
VSSAKAAPVTAIVMPLVKVAPIANAVRSRRAVQFVCIVFVPQPFEEGFSYDWGWRSTAQGAARLK